MEVFESGGGNPDFHNLLGRPPLRWIMAFRSRASSQSFYTTYVYIIVSSLSHCILPNRCFPVFGTLSLSIWTSQAGPPTLRNRIRLSIRLRILIKAPRIFWTHGSAAASAKRTEIRRAVHSFRVARYGVWDQGRYSRKLKRFLALKTSKDVFSRADFGTTSRPHSHRCGQICIGASMALLTPPCLLRRLFSPQACKLA